MFPRNDRYRLTVLETVMRRTDREFVGRMERITGMLLPPPRHGAPPPLDDATPVRAPTNSGIVPAEPLSQSRIRGWCIRLGRSWRQIVGLLWGAFLVAMAVVSSTVAGTVVCAVAVAVLLVLVGHRPIGRTSIRLGRAITTHLRRLGGRRARSESPGTKI